MTMEYCQCLNFRHTLLQLVLRVFSSLFCVFALFNLACQGPLGMENGGISDGKISASTELNGHLAIQGRLHFPASSIAGGWAAAVNDENQWLQIDLGNKFAYVTGVATQGRDLVGQWVTKYDLYYGDDGVSFTFYKVPRRRQFCCCCCLYCFC